MITKTRQKTAEMVLAELEVAYAKNQQDLDILEINKESLKNAILSQMEILFPADESAKWVNPDTGGTLTRIFANRFKFDIQKFIAILPAKVLAKVTKPVVDSKFYVAAMESGIVDNDRMTAIGAVEQIRDIRLKHEGGK
jgi:hypothetical protein